MRRVRERMDMRHKNTGKWAKMALEHGKHDPSLRYVPSFVPRRLCLFLFGHVSTNPPPPL